MGVIYKLRKMRARKLFIVVAYDITQNRRRNKIAKILEQYGHRINLSVFECVLTTAQFYKIQENIATIIDIKTDKVMYYTLCIDCYTKIVKYPSLKREEIQKIVIG